MRAQLVGGTLHHGGQVVLDGASLAVGPRARIGLVGPNGVGKSTVLRLLAGEEVPDGGAVVIDPPDLTVAHMPQEHDVRLARRTGIAAAEHELEAAAATLAAGSDAGGAAGRYDRALSRFLALGGGDLEPRASRAAASEARPASPPDSPSSGRPRSTPSRRALHSFAARGSRSPPPSARNRLRALS